MAWQRGRVREDKGDKAARSKSRKAVEDRRPWEVALGGLLFAAALGVLWALFGGQTESPAGFIVAGYAPEYRIQHLTRHIQEVSKAVSQVVAFSAGISPGGSIVFDHLKESELAAFGKELKDKCSSCKMSLCIGGGGRSDGFPQAAQSTESRKAFAKQVGEIVSRFNLDGVDLDWEGSQLQGASLSNFAQLVKQVKYQVGTKKTVSVALHAGQDLGKELYGAVDRLHLMAYDMISRTNWRHSTLQDCQQAVAFLTSRGADRGKIILGIPAYARGKSPGNVKTYAEIVEQYGQASALVDETAELYYNGIDTVADKVKWGKQQGLGGVFFWELGQDLWGHQGDLSLAKAASLA